MKKNFFISVLSIKRLGMRLVIVILRKPHYNVKESLVKLIFLKNIEVLMLKQLRVITVVKKAMLWLRVLRNRKTRKIKIIIARNRVLRQRGNDNPKVNEFKALQVGRIADDSKHDCTGMKESETINRNASLLIDTGADTNRQRLHHVILLHDLLRFYCLRSKFLLSVFRNHKYD